MSHRRAKSSFDTQTCGEKEKFRQGDASPRAVYRICPRAERRSLAIRRLIQCGLADMRVCAQRVPPALKLRRVHSRAACACASTHLFGFWATVPWWKILDLGRGRSLSASVVGRQTRRGEGRSPQRRHDAAAATTPPSHPSLARDTLRAAPKDNANTITFRTACMTQGASATLRRVSRDRAPPKEGAIWSEHIHAPLFGMHPACAVSGDTEQQGRMMTPRQPHPSCMP
eukprot:364262-Chlamydomonas_euryale.AAC.4